MAPGGLVASAARLGARHFISGIGSFAVLQGIKVLIFNEPFLANFVQP